MPRIDFKDYIKLKATSVPHE